MRELAYITNGKEGLIAIGNAVETVNLVMVQHRRIFHP